MEKLNMPTSDMDANRLILRNIEKTVNETKKELTSLLQLMYGKNGGMEATGLVETVHGHDEWIEEAKDRRKWGMRGIISLVLANIIALLSGVWYFLHFGQQ
jgi:hypothetical protein